MTTPFESLSGRLVVSVQAQEGSPIRNTEVIAALALAALQGGAAGLRLNGPEDIRRVRPLTTAPIIGLYKVHNGTRNIITPTLDHARALADAGADIIAVDATAEHLGEDFGLIGDVVRETGLPVMADVSTFDEGARAWDSGASIVGTTLCGYTPQSPGSEADGPNLDLVRRFAEAGMRTIGEGRYRTPEDVHAAFAAGAFAVVIGGAITDPAAITRRFVSATPGPREQP